MTMPYERTRAVSNTREFLLRLASPYLADGYKKIPLAVRKAALRLLRHYPSVVDLRYAEESFCAAEAERLMDEADVRVSRIANDPTNLCVSD